MSSSPPTTIGKYQIIREIARSNDIVYEAYDPLMDRRVAVKELNIPPGSTPQQLQDRVDRFEREARAAGRLAHPNIMTVYDVGTDGQRHFMAMEFLDGHTLRNEIDTHGSLPLDKVVEIASSVLEGLEHAHNNGVVHRDIKPENIQILSSGQIKITDFGIARLTFQPNLTVAGQVFGTPSYMSPEQVKGGEIDARSDLFSVGILLYEMIAGEKPFTGDSVIAITHQILNGQPLQPAKCSLALWPVIDRALEKSPGLRFDNARDMRLALQRAATVGSADVIPPFLLGGANPTGPVLAGPPPVINPYLSSNPAPASPPTYAYNPYTTVSGAPANPYGATTPHPSATGMPYGTPPPNVPVYYPPPPRKPLLTPEQAHFWRKLGVIFFTLAIFLGLVTAALMFFAGQLGPGPA